MRLLPCPFPCPSLMHSYNSLQPGIRKPNFLVIRSNQILMSEMTPAPNKVCKGFGRLTLLLHFIKYLPCKTTYPSPYYFPGTLSHKIFSSTHHVRSPICFAFTSPSSHTSKHPASHSRQGFICDSKIKLRCKPRNTMLNLCQLPYSFPAIPETISDILPGILPSPCTSPQIPPCTMTFPNHLPALSHVEQGFIWNGIPLPIPLYSP